VLLLATAPVLALSQAMNVGTVNGTAAVVVRCPHCNTPIAAATVGDYQIGFAVLQNDPKRDEVRLMISLTDRSGAPVNDARVVLALSMPEHRHFLKPRTASHEGQGRYGMTTGLAQMDGRWQAEVAITPPGGKVVKQVFVFYR